MSRYIFLFDLDSTVVREEVLQTVLKQLGIFEQLTADTLKGGIPFKQDFLKRVKLLKNASVSDICRIVNEIPLHEKIVEFIRDNQERCYIVTENLDVWIDGLVEKIGIESHVFCSRAQVKENYLQDVISIVDKSAIVGQMVIPFVAVGNGNNDAEMIEAAEIGIGYGGIKEPAASVLDSASHAIYEEEKLVEFLQRLV